MAFHINDIQCSQSRPKRNSNDTNTNDNNRSGISSNNNGATEQVNHEFKENGKSNINDPRTATNTIDIDTTNSKGGAIDGNFQLPSEKQFEVICSGTKNEYENKNIFAYEAYETSICDTSAQSVVESKREQFKYKDTNNNNNNNTNKNKCENKSTNKNHKNTLFIEVSNAKRFSEENRIEFFTAKERNNTDSESNRTNRRSDIAFIYKSKQEGPKRYHYNTITEYNKQFELLDGKPKAIDVNFDGRQAINKCRCEDVAFKCGNEWSNAAYCYS